MLIYDSLYAALLLLADSHHHRVRNHTVDVPHSTLVKNVLFEKLEDFLLGIGNEIERTASKLCPFYVVKNRSGTSDNASFHRCRNCSEMLLQGWGSVRTGLVVDDDRPLHNDRKNRGRALLNLALSNVCSRLHVIVMLAVYGA